MLPFKVQKDSVVRNKQTNPLVKHTIGTYGGIVEVAKNIKRRGGERHRVFGQLNISIFNFSLAQSVGARSAVSLWLTIVDSFIADLSVLPTWYPTPSPSRSISPLPLFVSLSFPRFPPSHPALFLFGLFVASIFFVVFHFEQPRFTPVHRQSRHSNHPRESNGYQAII